jgi:hypothetical protein
VHGCPVRYWGSRYRTDGLLTSLAATLPVEACWSQLQRQQTIGQGMPVSRLLVAPAVAKTTVLRAGTRFWVFDMTRWQRNRYTPTLPVPIVGGLSGAAGGFAEVGLESLVLRKTLPAYKTLLSQSAKLFFCTSSRGLFLMQVRYAIVPN